MYSKSQPDTASKAGAGSKASSATPLRSKWRTVASSSAKTADASRPSRLSTAAHTAALVACLLAIILVSNWSLMSNTFPALAGFDGGQDAQTAQTDDAQTDGAPAESASLPAPNLPTNSPSSAQGDASATPDAGTADSVESAGTSGGDSNSSDDATFALSATSTLSSSSDTLGENSTCKVVKSTGTIYYDTLTDAIAGVAANETIEIFKSHTISATATLSVSGVTIKNITAPATDTENPTLNGSTDVQPVVSFAGSASITFSASATLDGVVFDGQNVSRSANAMIFDKADTTLTIKDGSAGTDGTGISATQTKISNFKGQVCVLSGGSINMQSGSFSNNDCQQIIYITNSSSTFTMAGGTMTGNTCFCIIQIYQCSGTFCLSGGSINDNTVSYAVAYGSASNSTTPVIKTTGGSIVDNFNNGAQSEAGILKGYRANISVSNCKITGNTSTNSAFSAIYTYYQNTVSVSGSTQIIGNGIVATKGGAITKAKNVEHHDGYINVGDLTADARIGYSYDSDSYATSGKQFGKATSGSAATTKYISNFTNDVNPACYAVDGGDAAIKWASGATCKITDSNGYTVHYDTLTDAITAANSATDATSVIEIFKSHTITASVTATKSMTIKTCNNPTSDAYDYTKNGNNTAPVVTFDVAAQLTIASDVTLSGVIFDGGNGDDPSQNVAKRSMLSGIKLSSGKLTIEDGSAGNHKDGSVLSATETVFKNFYSSAYGAILHVAGGETVMNGGTVKHSRGNGAVYIGSGSFTMNGGNLFENYGSYVGALRVQGTASATISGGRISGNHATAAGAGIGVYDSATCNICGNAEISNNFAEGGGSAIYYYRNNAVKVNIYGSPRITGNTAKGTAVSSGSSWSAAAIDTSDASSSTGPTITISGTPVISGNGKVATEDSTTITQAADIATAGTGILQVAAAGLQEGARVGFTDKTADGTMKDATEQFATAASGTASTTPGLNYITNNLNASLAGSAGTGSAIVWAEAVVKESTSDGTFVKYYASLDKAITGATSGNVLEILKTHALTGDATTGAKSLTIRNVINPQSSAEDPTQNGSTNDTNGEPIVYFTTGTTTDGRITIGDGATAATVDLKGVHFSGYYLNGTTTGARSRSASGVLVSASATLNISDGDTTGSYTDGSAHAATSTIIENFVNTSSTTNAKSGGFMQVSGNVELKSGTIQGCKANAAGDNAYSGGGAVASILTGGTFTMSGGTITDNGEYLDSNYACCAVACQGGTFNMTGGIAKGNYGSHGGFCGSYGTNSYVHLSGGEIFNNRCKYDGGALHVAWNSCTALVDGNVKIHDNFASRSGGAIDVRQTASNGTGTVTIGGNAQITKNTCGSGKYEGAAVSALYTQSGVIVLKENPVIWDNTCSTGEQANLKILDASLLQVGELGRAAKIGICSTNDDMNVTGGQFATASTSVSSDATNCGYLQAFYSDHLSTNGFAWRGSDGGNAKIVWAAETPTVKVTEKQTTTDNTGATVTTTSVHTFSGTTAIADAVACAKSLPVANMTEDAADYFGADSGITKCYKIEQLVSLIEQGSLVTFDAGDNVPLVYTKAADDADDGFPYKGKYNSSTSSWDASGENATAMVQQTTANTGLFSLTSGKLCIAGVVLDGNKTNSISNLGVVGLVTQSGSTTLFIGDGTNTTKIQNASGGNGAGLCINGNTKTSIRENAVIANNVASSAGGGVQLTDGTLYLDGGKIQNNSAVYGTGVNIIAGTFTINSGMIGGTDSDGADAPNKATSGDGGGICAASGTTINMYGGTISKNTTTVSGGGIITQGTLNMSTGTDSDGNTTTPTIASNTATHDGGGIYLSGSSAKLDMSAGTFQNNTANGQGGAIYANGEAIMTGGTITENKAPSYSGGGMYVAGSGTFTMKDGSFTKNTSKMSGGGVYVYTGGKFDMYGGTIGGSNDDANSTSEYGGGVCTYTNTAVNLYGGTISYNKATLKGGGVAAWTGTNLTLASYTSGDATTTPTIASNTATTDGGGIYSNGATVTMSAGSIESNTASTSGGGVYLTGSSAKLTMTGGTIGGSSAKTNYAKCASLESHGGGVYADSGSTIDIQGGTISYNQATATNTGANSFTGGGVYLNSATLLMSSGHIDNNVAYSAGGGIFSNSGTVTVSGGSISSNTASHAGGGGLCHTTSGVVTLSGSVEVKDNAAQNGGGGVYFGGGTLDIQGGTISANKGTSSTTTPGGGIWTAGTDKVTFTMSGGTISGQSVGKGAGMCLQNTNADTTTTISGGTISGNSSPVQGGGIYASGSPVIISGGTITGNSATSGGAAVYYESTAPLTISGGSITANTVAAATHSAVQPDSADCTVTVSGNPTIYDNLNGTNQRNLGEATDANVATQIKVASAGLGDTAKIGVYSTNNGDEKDTFARTYNASDAETTSATSTNATNLGKFINDLDSTGTIVGIAKVSGTGTVSDVIWQGYVCKVTDSVDTYPFYKIQDAANFIDGTGTAEDGTTQISGSYPSGSTSYPLEMLIDYDDTENVTFTAGADVPITFTTAAKGDGIKYPYRGSSTADTPVATITRASTNTEILFTLYPANMTVTNLTIDGGGISVNTPGAVFAMGGESAESKTQFTIDSGTTIQNSINGGYGTICLLDFCNATFKSGTITGCKALYGGAFFLGEYSDSSSSSSIKMMSGSSISNCTATGSGGAIFADKSSDVEMGDGSSISNCTAAENGGAVYAGSQSSVVMKGTSSISSCTATGVADNADTGHGGGIYVYGGELTVESGAEINKCSAGSYGGGVYLRDDSVSSIASKLSLSGTISECTARVGGGILADDASEVTLSDGSEISKCVATLYGGGINASSSVLMKGGSIKSNVAQGGGAIYLTSDSSNNNGTLVISGGSITGNITVTEGSAAVVGQTAGTNTITVSGSTTITGNYYGTTDDDGNIVADTTNSQCNVLDTSVQDDDGDVDANKCIIVGDAGLNSDASIGVYSLYNESKGEIFGETTAAMAKVSTNAANLKKFTNDKNSTLVGMPTSSGNGVQWGNPICKVTNKESVTETVDGTTTTSTKTVTTPFSTLQDAFDYIAGLDASTIPYASTDTDFGATFPLEMIVDAHDLASAVSITADSDHPITFCTATTGTNGKADIDNYKYTDSTCTISRSSDSGAANATSSLFSMTNGSVVTAKTLTIDGASVSLTSVNGGAFNVAASSKLTIETDATLSNHVTTGSGGAINSAGTVNVSGGSISGNSAQKGGAVYATGDGGTLNISGGSISGNSAQKGGAIYDAGTATATISGGSITGNATTGTNAAAVEGETAGTNTITVSGSPTIYNNWTKLSPTSDEQIDANRRDVLDQADGSTTAKAAGSVIKVGSAGLSGGQIGVYSVNYYNPGNTFAKTLDSNGAETTAQSSTNAENLKNFVNDKNSRLTGLAGTGASVIWSSEEWVKISCILPTEGSVYDETNFVVEIKDTITNEVYRQPVTVTGKTGGSKGSEAVLLKSGVPYEVTLKTNNGTWRYTFASAANGTDAACAASDTWTTTVSTGSTANGTYTLSSSTATTPVADGQHELEITTAQKTDAWLDEHKSVVNTME